MKREQILAAVEPLLAAGYSWREAAAQCGLTKDQIAGARFRGGLCKPRQDEPRQDEPPPPSISDIVARLPETGCWCISGDPRDIRSDMRCGEPVAAHGMCERHYKLSYFKLPPKADLAERLK